MGPQSLVDLMKMQLLARKWTLMPDYARLLDLLNQKRNWKQTDKP